MAQSAVVAIDAESDFTAAFPAAGLGTTMGLWRFDAVGSSQSTGTGPGANNALAFAHTETSGGGSLTTIESNGLAAFGSIPAQSSRMLHLRLAIQGPFGDGTEGLLIEHRAAGGVWAEAGFVHGWAYAGDYTAGDTITDENGVDLTCVADGGWVDFAIAIPDTAAEVRLAPKYIVPSGQNSYAHDIALRQFHWSWSVGAAPVDLAGRATSVPAARGGLAISLALAGRAAVAPVARGALAISSAGTGGEPPGGGLVTEEPTAQAGPHYRTRSGDVLDDICWRHYGQDAARQVPLVLAANPGLADQEPVLPSGIVIVLPDVPEPIETAVVRLWT